MVAKIWSIIQGERSASKKGTSLAVDVELAKQEWLCAQKLSQVFTDPDLIDYATYLIKACEIKYVYLLRQMKQKEARYMPSSTALKQSDTVQ